MPRRCWALLKRGHWAHGVSCRIPCGPSLIFETHDRAFKKHSAVQGEFARLVKDDPRFDLDLRAFLGRAYNLKAIADYETGPGSHVSHEQAAEAITNAVRFVDALSALLSESS